jgi:hypothetical protein
VGGDGHRRARPASGRGQGQDPEWAMSVCPAEKKKPESGETASSGVHDVYRKRLTGEMTGASQYPIVEIRFGLPGSFPLNESGTGRGAVGGVQHCVWSYRAGNMLWLSIGSCRVVGWGIRDRQEAQLTPRKMNA